MEAQWKANVCGSEWEGNYEERTENKKEKHFSSLSSYGSHVIDEQTIFLAQLKQRLLCQEYLVILLKSRCGEVAQTSACLKWEQGKPLKVLYLLLAHEIPLFSSLSYLIIKMKLDQRGWNLLPVWTFFFFFLITAADLDGHKTICCVIFMGNAIYGILTHIKVLNCSFKPNDSMNS